MCVFLCFIKLESTFRWRLQLLSAATRASRRPETHTMDDVMTDRELLNHVFWCIDDPNPSVAFQSLTSWFATNRMIRDACKGDELKVWRALLHRAFLEWLETNELAERFANDGQHPKIQVGVLCEATRYHFHHPMNYYDGYTTRALRGFPTPRVSSAPSTFSLFMLAKLDTYSNAKHRARATAEAKAKGDPESQVAFVFPPLFQWIKPKWRDMTSWQRAVYDACAQVEANRRDVAMQAMRRARAVNGLKLANVA